MEAVQVILHHLTYRHPVFDCGDAERIQAGEDRVFTREPALVFITRKGLPIYREQLVGGKLHIDNSISITVGRLARRLKLGGVTHYRFRHTFKTVGKWAKDADALNLMMGHKDSTTGKVYDHEDIHFSRIKRVAVKVKKGLWPKPGGNRQTTMQLVGGGVEVA
jgi:integrase